MTFLRCNYCAPWAMIGLLLLSSRAAIALNPPPALAPEQIVRNAVGRARTVSDENRRADYTYTKQVVVEDLDNQGRVTETKEKLFRFKAGLGSLEQIKINGQQVGSARLKKEEERLIRQGPQLVDAKSARRDDHWEKYLTSELIAKYQFRLRERKLFNGR